MEILVTTRPYDSLKKHPYPSNRRLAGFTLIELMMVVAIIGTLAGIAVPMYIRYINNARLAEGISEIRNLELEIEIYRLDNDRLPSSLNDIGRQNLTDPWGRPYQYANHSLIPPGKRRKFHGTVPLNLDYDLFSTGADGQWIPPLTAAQSRDDIVRADDGGFIGLASQY